MRHRSPLRFLSALARRPARRGTRRTLPSLEYLEDRLVPDGSSSTLGANTFLFAASDDGRSLLYAQNATSFGDEGPLLIRDTMTGTDTTVAASIPSPGNPVDPTLVPVLSADGNFAAYVSDASGTNQVFLFDRAAGTSTLVSRASGSDPANPTPGDSTADNPVLSADGRFVAFESFSTDLVSGQSDSANTQDVFLFDRTTGAVSLVSRAAGTTATTANDFSIRPVMSSDGRFIAYTSLATNLVSGQQDTNNANDVFVFDRTSGANVLVSHASGSNTTAANDASTSPVLSRDGGWIAFASAATNLVSGQQDDNSGTDVFLFDRGTGTNSLVSGANGSPTRTGDGASDSPAINQDGSIVAFRSDATNLVPGVTDTNQASDVFAYSRSTGLAALASFAAGSFGTQTAQGPSDTPVLDPSGRFVGFRSKAGNLIPGQSNTTAFNAYRWDRTSGDILLASGQIINGKQSFTMTDTRDTVFLIVDGQGTLYFDTAVQTGSGIQNQGTFFNLPIIQVALVPAAVIDGSPPGTVAGTFTIAFNQPIAGQLLLPTVTLVAGVGDAGQFAINPASVQANAALVTEFGANRAAKAQYTIRVLTDAGIGAPVFRDFTIFVVPPSTPPGMGGAPRPAGIGMFDNSGFNPFGVAWYLRSTAGGGFPDAGPGFVFGAVGWHGLVGDWNGDGLETVGVVDPSGNPFGATWLLRNENSAGAPDILPFVFGLGNWLPIAGDWTGTGHSGIGAFDPTTGNLFLRNDPAAGAPSAIFQVGLPGFIPVAGDFFGFGHSGVGVVDPATMTWFLKEVDNAGGLAFVQLQFGAPGFKPVVGDWNGDGVVTVGVVDPLGNWFLRNSNSAGAPDIATFSFGLPFWNPVAGRFLGMAQPLRAVGAGVSGPAPEGGLAVALSSPGQESVSPQAAGLGRSTDPTSPSDEAFRAGDPGSPLVMGLDSAAGQIDLEAMLAPGMRRTGALDALFASFPA